MQYSTQTAQTAGIEPGDTPGQAGPRSLQGENARLQEENERLRHELHREHEMHIRNLADFDNYRRRVERERAQAARASKRELILPLIGIMDDFDRALQHARNDPQSPAAGLRSIHRRLSALLAEQGVTAFESRGEEFDPMLHEAAGSIKDDKASPGTVVEEVSRGWRWGKELLRPARVLVAQE